MGGDIAESQELSHTIANNARASILHMLYEGQVATTGNFASPLSPHGTPTGPVFKFSLYHLIDLDPTEEILLFPVTDHVIGSGTKEPAPSATFIDKDTIDDLESRPLAPLCKHKPAPYGLRLRSYPICRQWTETLAGESEQLMSTSMTHSKGWFDVAI